MVADKLKEIKGIKELLPFYDTFIFGLWGVLYEGGDRPLPGVMEALIKLKKAGKHIIILSNSAKPSALIASRFASIGITNEMYDGILSAGEVLYYNLTRRKSGIFSRLGKRCLHLGKRSDWYFSSYYERVFKADAADFILLNRQLFRNEYLESYLPILSAALERNLPMLSISADHFYYEEDNAILGAGSLENQYEKLGGLVIKTGKPDKSLFLYCLEALPETKKSKTIVIGDSIETDIKGADYSGLSSVFIAGGKHAKELDLYRGEPIDIEALEELSRVYGCFPSYATSTLQWDEL